ncbi:MAG: spore cortex biosynthesis protein YabQ [Bacillota bacterium]
MNYEFSPWLICVVFSFTGSILGAILDLYRVVRYFMRPGRWLTACGDILYWTMVTGVLFGLFGIVANGELRFYFFLFLLLGLGIYYSWFSHTLLRCYRMIGRWLITVMRAIFRLVSLAFKIVISPFAWLWKLILVPLNWLFAPFMTLVRKIKQGWRPPAPPIE